MIWLALLFLVELAAWGAIGFAGYSLAGWPAGAAAFVAAVTVWGIGASPKAARPRPVAWTVKALVFGAAVGGLALAGAVIAVIAVHAGVRLSGESTGKRPASPAYTETHGYPDHRTQHPRR